ncbi:MAG: hypothetical protein AAF518_14865, partial [Spirochaetota bacterium]
ELFKITFDSLKNDENLYWLPHLFYSLSKTKFELAFNYITTLVKSQDLKSVQIGLRFLDKFNREFVFSKQDWVRELLEHGKKMGEEFFDVIKERLYFLATIYGKSGSPDKPYPEDVALIEKSKIAIENSKFDYETEFYLKLIEEGEKSIERHRLDYERILLD